MTTLTKGLGGHSETNKLDLEMGAVKIGAILTNGLGDTLRQTGWVWRWRGNSVCRIRFSVNSSNEDNVPT